MVKFLTSAQKPPRVTQCKNPFPDVLFCLLAWCHFSRVHPFISHPPHTEGRPIPGARTRLREGPEGLLEPGPPRLVPGQLVDRAAEVLLPRPGRALPQREPQRLVEVREADACVRVWFGQCTHTWVFVFRASAHGAADTDACA